MPHDVHSYNNKKSGHNANCCGPCDGQAMVEFVVALVAIMVLFAAMVQFSRLGAAHTRAMVDSRRNAGLQSLASNSGFSGPDYIRDRTLGADGVKYSRDDGFTSAMPGAFSGQLISYSDPWDLNARRPGNDIANLYGDTFPQLRFGLVYDEQTEEIQLLPVIRNLVYNADAIEVEGDAWMTWTQGIY